MEGRYSKFVAMLLVVATVVSVVHGQTGHYCGMSQEGFNACRPAVTNTNNGAPLPEPTKDCCGEVKEANLTCLCALANSRPLLTAFNINKDAAMRLPAACNVKPNFHC